MKYSIEKIYANLEIITKSNKGHTQIIFSYFFDQTLKHL